MLIRVQRFSCYNLEIADDLVTKEYLDRLRHVGFPHQASEEAWVRNIDPLVTDVVEDYWVFGPPPGMDEDIQTKLGLPQE